MAQLIPLQLTVSCFSKIQIGFTFLVPAHLGSPGKRAVKRVCIEHSNILKMTSTREQSASVEDEGRTDSITIIANPNP